MYNTIIRMVSDQSEAEDILQETFIKVFKKLDTYKGDATLGAWIKRIAINSALNHIRSSKKHLFQDIDEQYDLSNEDQVDDKTKYRFWYYSEGHKKVT